MMSKIERLSKERKGRIWDIKFLKIKKRDNGKERSGRREG